MCVNLRTRQQAPRSVVVSALGCRLEDLGFESYQSYVGFFQPWPAPTQSWKCYGLSGKAGTTQPSFIHFMNVSEGVALTTWPTLQVLQFPGLINTGLIMTACQVVPNWNGPP